MKRSVTASATLMRVLSCSSADELHAVWRDNEALCA
jgi:hypothetical protein